VTGRRAVQVLPALLPIFFCGTLLSQGIVGELGAMVRRARRETGCLSASACVSVCASVCLYVPVLSAPLCASLSSLD
jgi:hypothetical protein